MLSKNFKELMKLLITFMILHVSHRSKSISAVKYFPLFTGFCLIYGLKCKNVQQTDF